MSTPDLHGGPADGALPQATRVIPVAESLADLTALAPIDPDQLRPRRVLDGIGARVIVIPFAEGQAMREHSAPLPILVQVLAGSIRFEVDGRAHELAAGGLINVDAAVPHALIAHERSHVQLTLLG